MLPSFRLCLEYAFYVGIVYISLKIAWTLAKIIVFNNILRAVSKMFPKEDGKPSYKRKKTPPKKPESKYLEKESEAKEVEIEILELPAANLEHSQTKVVGLVKTAVVGKFTALFAKKFLSNIMNLDVSQIRDKGYFQAKLLAERQAMGLAKNSRGF